MNTNGRITSHQVYAYVCILALVCSGVVGCGERKESLRKLIHVSMRSSALSTSEGVLQIQNLSKQPLDLLGLVRNVDNNQEKLFATGPLKPFQMVEIGRLEIGWTFEPNEKIAFFLPHDAGYAPATYVTFRAENGSVGIKKD
jgi:hypothetical protein